MSDVRPSICGASKANFQTPRDIRHSVGLVWLVSESDLKNFVNKQLGRPPKAKFALASTNSKERSTARSNHCVHAVQITHLNEGDC